MNIQEIQDLVLYRDGLILVINKPPGIPVHAGPKGGENLENYFENLRFELSRAPGLAHRLDRDTSGCLILGRHRKALARMGRLFSSGRVKKTYWAIVAGAPPAPQGHINLPLKKRSEEKRGWWMMTAPDGQEAVTDYKVLGKHEGMTWLELTPLTGRTHQLRVHCAEMGFPIIGDSIYGRAEDKTSGQLLQLHARSLEIPLYPEKPAIIVTAPPPAHMQNIIQYFIQDPEKA